MRFGKLTRSAQRTVGEAIGVNISGSRQEEALLNTSAQLNRGLDLDTDPADIGPEFLTDAKNTRCRRNKTSRRHGFEAITPAKPDSNGVLLYTSMKRFDGTLKLYRFTSSAIHLNTGAWTAAIGGALGGSSGDRFKTLAVNDRLFFSNNGILPLQEINLAANTYAQAGNSRRYKYYTFVGTRIVGANLAGPTVNPIEIGTCGDLNFAQWDPLIDISASIVPLMDTGGGFGDAITGIENISGVLVIFRERSIWMGTPQPIASIPFNYNQLIPDIGCSIPYSLSITPHGAVWYDQRLSDFFHLDILKGEAHKIGTRVGRIVFDQIADINQTFSAYNPVENEYMFGIIQSSSTIVKVWCWNELTDAWTYDELDKATGIWFSSTSTPGVVINALTGKINALVGKINALSTTIVRPTQLVGLSTGDILKDNPSLDTDNGAVYETVIASKTITYPSIVTYVTECRLDYIPKGAGIVTIEFSLDSGLTWKTYKTKTLSSSVGKREIITCTKHIRARNFTWRVRCSTGLFELIGFEVQAYKGDKARA